MTNTLKSKAEPATVTLYRARKMLGVWHNAVLSLIAKRELDLVTVDGQPRVTLKSVQRLLKQRKET